MNVPFGQLSAERSPRLASGLGDVPQLHAPTHFQSGNSYEEDLADRLVEAFLPFQPVQKMEGFSARNELLRQVIQAIAEYRNHIVIYGPAGCGKTSLAKVLSDLAQRSNFMTFYVSGTRTSTLRTLFEPILAQLPIRLNASIDQRGVTSGSFMDLLPDGQLTPPILAEILSQISGARILICIDEVDQMQNEDAERDILEMMKLLSDRSAPVHVVAIGVARTAEDLFGGVASLPRSVFEVTLGVMTWPEMSDMIAHANQLAGLAIAADAVTETVLLANGKPFVGKLLALAAAKEAVRSGADVVTRAHLEAGLADLMLRYRTVGASQWLDHVEANPRLLAVLRAAMRAPRDLIGSFGVKDLATSPLGPTQADVRIELERICGGREMLLEDVSDGRRDRFRFTSIQAELCATILCSRPVV